MKQQYIETKLNLGCADKFLPPPYINVDLKFPPAWVVPKDYGIEEADLRTVWPWDDSSIAAITAHDIIEHLPDRIHTMNEMWRVLQPGGQADILVPDALMGAGFIQDPTHVSMWTMNSFQYYQSGSFATGRLGDAYGITARFKVVTLEREELNEDPFDKVYKVHAVLEAVK